MKIVTEEYVMGGHPGLWPGAVQQAYREIKQSITGVVWPEGANSFTINPMPKGNGVRPIKDGFINQLTRYGWTPEARMSISQTSGSGRVDAAKIQADTSMIAVEWETGNISSSHRALNKMALGMFSKQISAGFLVLPEKKLYNYLTDRIGNIDELRPYFPVWTHLGVALRQLELPLGVLCVIGFEHDAESTKVDIIQKGKDGNSLVRRGLQQV